MKGSFIFYILRLWWFYLLLKLLSSFVSDFVVVVVRLADSYDCCPVCCHLCGAALCQVTSCNSFWPSAYWFTTKQRSLLILPTIVLVDNKTAVCFSGRTLGLSEWFRQQCAEHIDDVTWTELMSAGNYQRVFMVIWRQTKMKALGLTMTFTKMFTNKTVAALMLVSECTGQQANVSAEMKISSVWFMYTCKWCRLTQWFINGTNANWLHDLSVQIMQTDSVGLSV